MRIRFFVLIIAVTISRAFSGSAFADIFPVDVSQDQDTLYVDPNTGGEIKIGGFSGMASFPGDPSNRIFYVVTDRGPTVDFGAAGKGFPVPDLSPAILTVRLQADGTGQLLRKLPLRKLNGEPLTGLPNTCLLDEDPVVDLTGAILNRDPDGLDIEGIATGPGETFWVCEEYRPSVALVSPDGRVQARYVPQGSLCGGETIPTFEALPGILKKRINNRGLEGIANGGNGLVYAIMQRPLANPNRAASEASRNLRLLEIDWQSLLQGESGAVRQLLYVTEGPANRSTYASDITPVAPDVFIVSERRTDKAFAIRVTDATDITGLEDASGVLLDGSGKTIEQLSPAELSSRGILPVEKVELLASLKALDPALDKCEGVTVSGDQLVLCPDNDFNLLNGDFATNPATLVFQDPPNLPKIITTPLPAITFP